MVQVDRMRIVSPVLAFIVMVGIVLRLHFLNQPMRYDESYNYLHYAIHSVPFILGNYVPNNHIFHTLMVHFVSGGFGDSPPCLRLPALVGGVLLIPVVAWTAWVLSRSVFATIFAAMEICVSSALIEYSTNARGYSWLALFAAIQFAITLHAIRLKRSLGVWAIWGIVGALGALTVPVMFLWCIALSVAVLATSHGANSCEGSLRSTRRCAVWGLAICATISGILYAPAMITSGLTGLESTHRMSQGILEQQLPGLGDPLIAAARLFARDSGIVWQFVICVGIIFASINGIIRRERALRIAILAATACIASITLLRVPLPARAWLFLWPIAIAISAVGLQSAIEFSCARMFPVISNAALSRRTVTGIAMSATAATCVMPLANVWHRPYLVSEPGGLVDVEPAIDACREFGWGHCTVIGPYTPATKYYLRRKHMTDLPLATDPSVQRIFIIAANSKDLNKVWNDHVAGYENFGETSPAPLASSQFIYSTDRREASCDKYLSTLPAETH